MWLQISAQKDRLLSESAIQIIEKGEDPCVLKIRLNDGETLGIDYPNGEIRDQHYQYIVQGIRHKDNLIRI